MIYNQAEGFDNDLSLYDVLNSNKLISGSPVSYRIEGLEETKFRLSTLKETIRNDEEFRKHYYALAESVLSDGLAESSRLFVDKEVEEIDEVEEIINDDDNE